MQCSSFSLWVLGLVELSLSYLRITSAFCQRTFRVWKVHASCIPPSRMFSLAARVFWDLCGTPLRVWCGRGLFFWVRRRLDKHCELARSKNTYLLLWVDMCKFILYVCELPRDSMSEEYVQDRWKCLILDFVPRQCFCEGGKASKASNAGKASMC